MAFVILCKTAGGRTLARGNRDTMRLAGELGWWTANPANVQVFNYIDHAERILLTLKYNEPRIVGKAEGLDMLRAQLENKRGPDND